MFFDVAVATNNTKPCFFIENSQRAAFCVEKIAIQTQNVEICKLEIKPHHKAKCFMNLAIAMNDPNICEKCTEIAEVFGEYCRNSFSDEEQ